MYLRHNLKDEYLVPVFNDEFTKYKLMYITTRTFLETDSLEYDLVWAIDFKDKDIVSFIHCKSGIHLYFEENRNAQIVEGQQVDDNYQASCMTIPGEKEKLLNHASFFKVIPSDRGIDANTALRNYHTFKLNLCEAPDKDSIKFLKLQEAVIGNTNSTTQAIDSRITIDSEKGSVGQYLFSVVKLNDKVKREIDFIRDISSCIKLCYEKFKGEEEQANEYARRCVTFIVENTKLFSLLQDFMINNHSGYLRTDFEVGSLVLYR